jgi:hypothetical protein
MMPRGPKCLALPVVAILAGCSTSKPPPDAATVPPPPEETGGVVNSSKDVGIRAFHDVCLANAPSFAGVPEAARTYGVNGISAERASMEMSKDRKISVQLKPGTECVVTTESRTGSAVEQQFLAEVVAVTGSKATQVPLVGKIGGSSFVFHHDRTNGEAYVMVKR